MAESPLRQDDPPPSEGVDMSQEVLAERADRHRTYVSDIDQGSRNPSLVNIVQLAMGLEITVARLFQEYGVEAED